MNNPFYVQPASAQPMMQGATNLAGAFIESGKADAKKEKMLQGAELLKGQDTQAISSFLLENPEVADEFTKMADMQDKFANKSRAQTAKDILTNRADGRAEYQSRYDQIVANGGTAPQLKELLEDPNADFTQAALKDLSVLDPATHKSFLSSQGGSIDSGTAARETEWFLRQSPKVQKIHMELKRKVDPTLAEKLQYELDKESGKADITKNTAMDTEFMKKLGTEASGLYSKLQSAAQQASAFIPRLKSLKELSSRVNTGTGAEIKLAAKKALGIDSADMEELNAKLGELAQDILNQQTGTKTDFDFKNAVRQSAALGNTKEANARLIDALIDRQLEAVNFGDMAKEAYDKGGVKSVLDMRFSETAQPQGAAQATTGISTSDAELLKKYGIE